MEEENKHIDELIANYLTEGLDKPHSPSLCFTSVG